MFALIVCSIKYTINFMSFPYTFVKFWFLISALHNKKLLRNLFLGFLLNSALPYFTNLIVVSEMS